MKENSSKGKKGFGSSGGRSSAVSGTGVSSVPWMKALTASQKKEQLEGSHQQLLM